MFLLVSCHMHFTIFDVLLRVKANEQMNIIREQKSITKKLTESHLLTMLLIVNHQIFYVGVPGINTT